MSSGGLFSFRPELGETPETLKRRRAVAEAMMGGGAAPTTIGGGLSSLGSSIASALMARAANRQEAAGQASANADFAKVLAGFGGSGGGTEPIASADPAALAAAGMTPDYRSAIAGLESSGRYDAIGPTNAKLGRPLGKYQIMEANLAPWSQAALGRTVTPDEFLADPKIQDAVFDAKFGEYVKQFGPEGAAQAWLGGPGAVGKTGRRDVLGTSVGDYGKRFTEALGGTSAVTDALSGSTGGYIDLSPLAKISSRDAAQGVGTPIQQPRGLVIHHTGGRGTAEDVMDTLNQRGFSVQYVIDRDGKIYQTLPEGTAGQHIRTSRSGLSNANTFGVEVIANDDSDVTPAQIEAARKLAGDLGGKYGFDANSVFGHGEINPHKQHTEGSTIVNAIRGGGGGQPAVTAALAGTEPVASAELAAMAAAGLGPGPGAGPPIREPLAAPTVPPAAPAVAPAAPPAAGVAPVARALGIDPLPQTSGLTGPVASAGHESLSPHIAAVANALRPSPAAAAPPGSVVAAPAGGGGGVPSAAAPVPETAALPGTEPVAGVPEAAPAAGGFSPRAQQAIAVMSHPWASESQKAVAGAILDQEIQQADPLHQAQLEKIRLDIEQQRNPPKSRDLTPQEIADRGYNPDRRYRESPEGDITEVPGTKRETIKHENLIVDANTGELIATIPDPGYRAATPEEAAKYGAAAGQFDLSNNKFEPINPPSGFSVTVGPDGTVNLVQGPGAGKGLTEGQSKDTVYVTRAEGALPTLDKHGNALTSFPERMMQNDPTGLFKGQQSAEFQLAYTAGLEFLQAILRKDSQGQITEEETVEYGETYLPQPGDGPERLEYKRQARRRAVEAIRAGLPPAAALAIEKAGASSEVKTGTTGEVIEPAGPDAVDWQTYFEGQ